MGRGTQRYLLSLIPLPPKSQAQSIVGAEMREDDAEGGRSVVQKCKMLLLNRVFFHFHSETSMVLRNNRRLSAIYPRSNRSALSRASAMSAFAPSLRSLASTSAHHVKLAAVVGAGQMGEFSEISPRGCSG